MHIKYRCNFDISFSVVAAQSFIFSSITSFVREAQRRLATQPTLDTGNTIKMIYTALNYIKLPTIIRNHSHTPRHIIQLVLWETN